MRNKIKCAVIALCLLFSSGCSGGEKGSVFLDKDGNVIGRVTSEYGSVCAEDGIFSDYIVSAMTETVNVVCEKQQVDIDRAYEYLYKFRYEIKTGASPEIQKKLTDTLSAEEYSTVSDLCAVITDHGGTVIASYSNSVDTENLSCGSLRKHTLCSAIKPLGVYAPLLDSGKLTWSSVMYDDYVKKVQRENGEYTPWPQNANGKYLKKNITVDKAISDSVNTVAVKWLGELGVSRSCEFLGKLGISTEYELQKAKAYGDEEVIGNLALGYLNEGASAEDMAGYYGIFASGGMYEKPHTVLSVYRDSRMLYKYDSKPQRVIKESTAYIMNRLLYNVTDHGTGREAFLPDVEVCGKTGTSSGFEDNWFVGVTTEYCGAFYHSAYTEDSSYRNIAPRLFGGVFRTVSHKEGKFATCDGVEYAAFCPDSGEKWGKKCPGIGMGYFLPDDVSEPCSLHK